MSAAEHLSQPEPELGALVSAVEALEREPPREPPPVEPGAMEPARCIWRSLDPGGEGWTRCERRARVVLGFVASGRASREPYCVVHALSCLRDERIVPAKVWRLDREEAPGA